MNTPRTDANESLTCKEGDPCIAPDFARQLERELAAMTALVDQMASALRESRDVHLYTIDRCPNLVREAITAYEHHKKIYTS